MNWEPFEEKYPSNEKYDIKLEDGREIFNCSFSFRKFWYKSDSTIYFVESDDVVMIRRSYVTFWMPRNGDEELLDAPPEELKLLDFHYQWKVENEIGRTS